MGDALRDFQVPYAHPVSDVKGWDGVSLLETVRRVKPTVLIGTSTVPGALNKELVQLMASNVDRPAIFPLSNPTRLTEATPEQLLTWTDGRALVATGSPFEPIPLNGVNYQIGQANADDLCVIRSMYTDVPNHEPSMFMMNSGHVQSVRPSYGSWLLYGLGTENQNLPGYVVLGPGHPVNGAANWSNRFLPGVYQGTHLDLRPNFEPRNVIAHLANSQLSTESQRRQLDLIQTMNRLQLQRRGQEPLLEARIESFEMAFRMQAAAPEAFDIGSEPESIREMYGLGRGPRQNGNVFAMNCLLARRLVERGVRVVQVYFGVFQPWDTHSDNAAQHRARTQVSDRPIAALLKDLKQRGLLDETLVHLGRRVRPHSGIARHNGRDHNHWGFSRLARRRRRQGRHGPRRDRRVRLPAAEKRVHVHDLHATMLHLMGIDHERLTYRYSGRDHRLTDVPAK